MNSTRILGLAIAIVPLLSGAARAQNAPTREQVHRELAIAERNGDIPFGETGVTPAQLNPSRYAAARERDRDREGSYAQK